jgi:uncharacterized membrane protein
VHLNADDVARAGFYRQAMFYMHSFGWGWWLLMSIGMLALWVLIIYGLVWLFRGGSSQRHSDDSFPAERFPPERPEEILKRRLAEGDISIEEYQRLLGLLKDEPRQHSMAGR